jgi:hypothetical protein
MVLLMDIFYKIFVNIFSMTGILCESVANEHFCLAEDICHMHWYVAYETKHIWVTVLGSIVD